MTQTLLVVLVLLVCKRRLKRICDLTSCLLTLFGEPLPSCGGGCMTAARRLSRIKHILHFLLPPGRSSALTAPRSCDPDAISMETIWDTAGTEKKKRHFSNGWFFLWSSPLDFVWGRCRRLSGLMQEALGSDAGGVGGSGGQGPALLCHQDGLLPHLQDV